MTFTQDELALMLDALENHCKEIRSQEQFARKYGGSAYADKLDNYAMFGIHVHAKLRDLFEMGVYHENKR